MVFLVFWDSIPKRCKGVHCVDLGESFPTSIYLAKCGFDTAENEPCKVCPLSVYRSPRSVRARAAAARAIEAKQLKRGLPLSNSLGVLAYPSIFLV